MSILPRVAVIYVSYHCDEHLPDAVRALLHCAYPAERLAHVEFGEEVTAIVGRDTMIGTQFHPEKSQSAGLRLIANFLTWRP